MHAEFEIKGVKIVKSSFSIKQFNKVLTMLNASIIKKG